MDSTIIIGNIFNANKNTIIIPVNTSGEFEDTEMMLTFRIMYPKLFTRYKELCRAGILEDNVYVYDNSLFRWERVVLFPTKEHKYESDKTSYIKKSFDSYYNKIAIDRRMSLLNAVIPLLRDDEGKFINLLEELKDRLRDLTGETPCLDVWDHDIEEPNPIWKLIVDRCTNLLRDSDLLKKTILECSDLGEAVKKTSNNIEEFAEEVLKRVIKFEHD